MEVPTPTLLSGASTRGLRSHTHAPPQHTPQLVCPAPEMAQHPRRPHTPPTASPDAAVKPPAYTPYLDSPPPSHHGSPMESPRSQQQQRGLVFQFCDPDCQVLGPRRPSFSSTCSEDGDDDDDQDYGDRDADADAPAHLPPGTREPPPAYSALPPPHARCPDARYPAAWDIDAEAALERILADDVQFVVERTVAMGVVVAVLVLGGLVVGVGVFRS
ncbi:hypothetical protein C7974DRAFT_408277 [Boeremia exigua]|uniref:uncharacterized protein n=1 Tax=Boeremia exigua TaxID=749465 RepID=UPI001E8E980D|nr:uncharacterized protein C7974DRAFT_408277 [Boeremia exigua]KAH6644609.1 hypothetical protein C7974DRAFT_408277 [Boeremia exigua]